MVTGIGQEMGFTISIDIESQTGTDNLSLSCWMELSISKIRAR